MPNRNSKKTPLANKNILIRVTPQVAKEMRDWFAHPLMPFIHFDVPAPGGVTIRVEISHPGNEPVTKQ